MKKTLIRYARDPKTGAMKPPGSEVDIPDADIRKWEKAKLIQKATTKAKPAVAKESESEEQSE